jgi:hypothetical protein
LDTSSLAGLEENASVVSKEVPMKATRKVLLMMLLAAAALASGAAFASGSVHFSIGIGIPLWGPGYYYPPYYPYYYPPAYYPPTVSPAQPQRYVEAQQAPNVWYYCADAKAYYPYVKDCPGGWQRVSPTPR